MPILNEPLLLPESQAEVPECVKEAKAQIKLLRGQLDAACASLRVIQSMCEHPANEQVGGKDYSGTYSTLCKVCGLDR